MITCGSDQDLPQDRFAFLKTAALTAGADEAIIIPASLMVVEDRVGLKCKNGCPSYGRSLTCPPHVPDIRRFRSIPAMWTGEYAGFRPGHGFLPNQSELMW